VQRLVGGTERIGQGDWQVQLPVEGGDELSHVSGAFNRMVRQLRETTVSRAALEDVFQAMTDALFVVEEDGRVRRVNGAACRLLGREPAGLVGRPLSALLEARPGWSLPGLGGAGAGSAEALALSATGTGEPPVPVHVEGAWSAQLGGAVLVARDMREAHRLISAEASEAELRRYNQRLEATVSARTRELEHANAALEERLSELHRVQDQLRLADRLASLGTLTAGIAHEINNPLAYVMSNLDFAQGELKGKPGLDEETLAALREAHEGAERIRAIVRGLRTFSRHDEEARRAVDPREVLDVAVGMAKNEVRHRARLVKSYGPVPRVWASEHRLGQVFLNLVVNAAQAIPEQFRKGEVSASRKLLTNTTAVGKLASIPVVTQTVNASNRSPTMRKLLDKTLGVHPQARVPTYHSKTARKRLVGAASAATAPQPTPAGPTRGRVALFVTCYGNYNMPQVVEDLAVVLRHNGIEVKPIEQERCCGMPKLEIGDLDAVARYKEFNLPRLAQAVEQGWDLMAPVPSCVLMFRQEIPLMFPEDAQVAAVKARIFDPFEYLMHRHRAGLLNTQFTTPLGKVAYHAPCHQRVQNIGPKTRELLGLVPGTEIEHIERCSGHDGTYGVRSATYELSVKLVKPVARRVEQSGASVMVSDCPMAADHIANQLPGREAAHPISLLRKAYGL
jgi:Fe-S oxidoreductase/signal transduction histidine kinase